MRLITNDRIPCGELDDAPLRERYHAVRAEAEHLRFSLAETECLLQAIEDELRVITMRPPAGCERDEAITSVIPAIVRARTATRRALFSQLEPGGERNRVYRDLRMAEVSFAFLLSLATLKQVEERS
jgi:hypothetical protein